jgi:hypothetical protein
MAPRRSAPWSVLGLALSALVAGGAPASAQTFDAMNRGWFNSNGAHTATNLTVFVGQGSGATRFRGFLVFDLAALTQPVGSGVLRLELEAYLGPDASEVFSVYDVSTPVADLLLTQVGRTDVYDDLGGGTAYAIGVVGPADVGTVVEVPLTDEAVGALNAAAGGRVALGFAAESLRLPTGNEGMRFSFTSEPRVHQLVLAAPVAPPSVSVAPELAAMVPPADHSVVASVTDAGGAPLAGVPVDFQIASGPHAGASASVVTDEAGEATFSYPGSAAGVDVIQASLAGDGASAPSGEATAVWDVDCNTNGIPDACDLACSGWDGACEGFPGCGESLDLDGGGEPDECFVAPPPPPPPANTPPDCSAASASRAMIHRPNHKFREISIAGVVDADGDALEITVEDVYQDEITEPYGRRSTCPDASGLGRDRVWLRAERSERGDGRVYQVDFTADDGKGGVCEGSVEVCVPQVGRRGKLLCGDQGPRYDSQTCERWDYRGHRGKHRRHHGRD